MDRSFFFAGKYRLAYRAFFKRESYAMEIRGGFYPGDQLIAGKRASPAVAQIVFFRDLFEFLRRFLKFRIYLL